LEIVLAKGIRVNQLAKELNVPSKLILDKCRDEGLGEKVPNHMSVLSLGLAETVREWFAGHVGGGGGTAVETAPPVEAAVKTKPARTKKKKEEGIAEDEFDNLQTAIAEAPTEPPAPRKRPSKKPFEEMPVQTEPVAEAPPVIETPVQDTAQIVSVPVVETPPLVSPPPAIEMPALSASSAVAEAPVKPAATPTAEQARPHRPTITLANRTGAAPPPERKPVVPAPQLMVPKPAQIQGPRVVREEKPDVVATPRSRAARPVAGSSSPGFTPARPQGGRGVKSADDDGEDAEKKKAAAKSGRTLSARRRGPDGRRGEAMEKLKEYTEADLIERRDRLNAAASYRAGFDSHVKKSGERGQHQQAKSILQRGEPVQIEEPITVKNFSAALGIKANDIIGKLMKQGIFATINQALAHDVAEAIALEYGIELQIVQEPSLEEKLQQEFVQRRAEATDLVTRPPVVTILGHVDHGKTSLLDKIRNANVAAGEAGGITQHTAAWMVTLGDGDKAKKVTFIDTPGHQAFTSMRARGANMTDVVVLVVSAAEGVQPQTVESINHARAAGVPIVVALNKIDRPDVNEPQVLGQLAANGVNPVEWGGDTEVVRTSAVTGQGIEDLIEILHYQSELLELKADPSAPARGSVIESRMDEGLGAVATVLVQEGTLHVGDILLCGPGYGRIRSLLNDRMQPIQEAGPATPVIVSGLDVLPNAGDKFYVLDDLERVRAIATERQSRSRHEILANRTQVTLDNIFSQMKAGDVKTINLIIKADVQGSVETLQKTVTDANTDEVKVRVIHAAVGGITESDVELADASSAVIIGFHVVPDESARVMAEQRRVEIRLYRVIYEIFDDLKKALSGLLEPEIREKLHGHAEVRQVFKVSRVGNIAGCMVTDGHIQRGSKVRLSRGGIVITEDLAIETLRRMKDDVKEVKSGFECGIKLAGYDDIKIGDIMEAYIRETFQRTL
jgi:translation initiation factor IF-2